MKKILLTNGLFAALISLCLGHQHIILPKHKVTLKQAHVGNLEIDTYLLDSYKRVEEKKRSFYLDARKVLFASDKANLRSPEVVKLANDAEIALIGEPMLGNLSSTGISVWFRPAKAGKFQVLVKGPNDNAKSTSFKGEASTAGAPTRIVLSGLSPAADFNYFLQTEGGKTLKQGSFTTAPKPGTKQTYKIAFGSCFHKIGVHNPNLMELILKRDNLGMLLLGDSAVDDREARLNEHTADYLLRDVSIPWRNFAANIPSYASWDDHDYLNNDKAGLQKNQINEATRDDMRAMWQDNWNNPPTPVRERGIYFNTVIGDTEIIMLDTRSCRIWEKRGEKGSYLGPQQTEWLYKTLKASEAKFIILCSGTMWADYMSNGKDSWGTWDKEGREEFFQFIEENDIKGILYLSGDRHGARAYKTTRPSGLVMPEFCIASLGGVRGPPAKVPAKFADYQMFGYASLIKAFGEFTFDTSKDDPEVTFRLINEEEKVLETMTFKRSELSVKK